MMETMKVDRETFEVLVAKYEKTIFNIAYRMVNDYEDAMDITQTVFLKAYEKLDTYNPTHKFFSWFYRICINESLNHITKRKREVKLDRDIPTVRSNPETGTAQREANRHLQCALMSLKFNYRAVLVLKHIYDFSYKEISEIMEIPEKTVKSRLFSGRQLLKESLLKQGFTR